MPPFWIWSLNDAAVGGHERDAVDHHVVDLPARVGLLHRCSRSGSAGRPAACTAVRTVTSLSAARHLDRLHLDRLVAVCGERGRVGAHEQRAELLRQRLLLRVASPAASCGRRRGASCARSRSAAAPSPRRARRPCACCRDCRSLSALMIGEHLVGDALDERVGRFLGERRERRRARRADEGTDHARASGWSLSCRVVEAAMRPQRCGRGGSGGPTSSRRGSSCALLKRNWPISFSSTTADCVIWMRSPLGELLVVAAGFEPDVGLAQQARGEDRGGRVLRERVALVERERDATPGSARCRSGSRARGRRARRRSSPGARTLRPPMLSKRASTR